MDDVACSGSESKLTYCSYTSSHNCGHNEDASVQCQQNIVGYGLTNNYTMRLLSAEILVYSVSKMELVKIVSCVCESVCAHVCVRAYVHACTCLCV